MTIKSPEQKAPGRNPADRLNPAWMEVFANEFAAPYMADLRSFLSNEIDAGRRSFPRSSDVFRALELVAPQDVRVVIIGQDPYHGAGQAHGLSFSVLPGVRIPPSLANIYEELNADLGIAPAGHGFLEHWANQGVLLLNSVLTVGMGRPGSHRDRGWERFTDAVVRTVVERSPPSAFMLWGAYAQKKAAFVDGTRHLAIRSPHPSPYSARSGFFGSRPFSKADAFLEANGRTPVDWRLPATLFETEA